LQHEAFGLSWPPYHLHSACCPVVGAASWGRGRCWRRVIPTTYRPASPSPPLACFPG